ncbi:hypothetical protein WEI85_16645 [Actinomycetes bacterium KLBMP 9797]
MMKTMDGKAAPAPAAKRSWSRPRVECLETRPEVTAYSGDGWPWLTTPR